MQHKRFGWALAVGLCLGFATLVVAEEPKPTGMPEMTPEDLERMNRAMTPGENHALLAQMAGEWSYKSTAWMAPGAAAMTSAGTASKKMSLGGRYLEEVQVGNFMGMPFEGHALTAYDNVAKVFKGTWIDNFGTGIIVVSGQKSPDGKAIELRGDYVNPMTGLKEEIRLVTRVLDADTHSFEYFSKAPGQEEFKGVEIVYSRQKP